MDNEDWLGDPLRIIEGGSYKSRKLRSHNEQQSSQWQSFHFASRLKLNGADHFCRQALGAGSMSDDIGLPFLAHRQLEWYLGALFFELMSACDTLLQELNIVYAYDLGLKPEKVRWNEKKKNKFMEKLPEDIFKYIEEERKKDWFYKVKRYRDTSTHHYLVPLGSETTGWGPKPSSRSEFRVSMYYQDKEGQIKSDDIIMCKDYLSDMVDYISSVWEKMTQEFE